MATTPHNSIGCQEILATGDVSHSGFLRKQMTLGKNDNIIMSKLNKLAKKLWLQRYVVLSEGSLYHYDNETAKKPKGCYSLSRYYQVVQAGEISHGQQPWAFKIIHETGDSQRTKYFAAASERDLKIWQRELRKQLLIANGLHSRITSMGTEDVDAPIYSPGSDISTGDNDSDDSEEDKDDYLSIDDSVVNDMPKQLPPRPLPDLPREEKGNTMILNRMKVIDENRNSWDDAPPVRAPPSRPPLDLPRQSSVETAPVHPPPRKNRPPAELPKPPSPSDHKSLQSKVSSPPHHSLPRSPLASPGSVDDPKPRTPKKPIGVPLPGIGGAPPVTQKPRKPSFSQDTDMSQRPIPRPPNERKAVLPPNPQGSIPDELDLKSRTIPRPPDQRAAMHPPSRKPSLPPSDSEEPLIYDSPNEPSRGEPTVAVDLTWRDFFWSGTDKTASQQILKQINEEGAFLVRDSEDNSKTLMCLNSEGKPMKFRITQTADGQVWLNPNWPFPSIESLLSHYMHNYLPGKQVKLSVPYNKRVT